MPFLSRLKYSSVPHKATLGSSYLDRFYSSIIFNFSMNFPPHPLSVKLKDMGFHCAPLGHWNTMVDSLHLFTGIGNIWSARDCVLFV